MISRLALQKRNMSWLGVHFGILLIIYRIVTLASPGCDTCLYGACDESGVCSEGCATGYAGRKCRHACQLTCRDSSCILNKNGQIKCTKGCVDGYCGVQCKARCPSGCLRCDQSTCNNCSQCRSSHYGAKCESSCFNNCSTHVCDNDGNCLSSCLEGFYGSECKQRCSSRFRSCRKYTGECIRCKPGYYGDSCENDCPPCIPGEMQFAYRCLSSCMPCIDDEGPLNNILRRLEVKDVKNDVKGVSFNLQLLCLFVVLLCCVQLTWGFLHIVWRVKNFVKRKRRRRRSRKHQDPQLDDFQL